MWLDGVCDSAQSPDERDQTLKLVDSDSHCSHRCNLLGLRTAHPMTPDCRIAPSRTAPRRFDYRWWQQSWFWLTSGLDRLPSARSQTGCGITNLPVEIGGNPPGTGTVCTALNSLTILQ